MKSSRGVQQHDIDSAADALVAERLRPTVERVRERLGRGSPNTIGPMLETWFSGLATRLGVAPEAQEGGSTNPATVRRMADDLWAKALELACAQAEAGVNSLRKELDARFADVAAIEVRLLQERDQLESREALSRETVLAAQSQRDLALARGDRLESELGQAAAEMAGLRDRLERLQQEKDEERSRSEEQLIAHARERERAQERSAANERRMLEDVDRARQETKLVRRESADELRKLEATNVRLSAAATEAVERLSQATLENAALRERVAASEHRASEYQTLVLTIQGRSDNAAAKTRPTARAIRPAPPRRVRTSAKKVGRGK